MIINFEISKSEFLIFYIEVSPDHIFSNILQFALALVYILLLPYYFYRQKAKGILTI